MHKLVYLVWLALMTFPIVVMGQSQGDMPIIPENAAQVVQLEQIGQGHFNDFIFSPDGQTMVLAGSLGLWRLDMTASDPQLERLGTQAIHTIAYNSTGTLVATGGTYGMVQLWDTQTWEIRYRMQVHHHNVRHVEFNPTDSQLAAVVGDTIQLLDVQMGEMSHQLRGHRRPIYDVAYRPDGLQIATASFDDTVKLWDAHTGELQMTLDDHPDSVLCVKYNPEGNLVASTSYDGMVRVFDSTTGELLQTLDGQTQVGYQLAYAEEGKTLFSLAQDNTVCSWDVGSGEVVGQWHVPPASLFAQHPDGRIIMMNSHHPPTRCEQPLRLWDLQTDETLFTFPGCYLPPLYNMTYLPEVGRMMTEVFNDGLWVWDIATWQVVEVLKTEVNFPLDIRATSPNGRLTAHGDESGVIILTDTQTGDAVQMLFGHTQWISGLTFTDDGTRLISTSYDGTIRIWGLP